MNDAVHNAERALDAANLAAETNAADLKSVQADIAALEKVIPRVTRLDLVRQQMRDTQARRAGL